MYCKIIKNVFSGNIPSCSLLSTPKLNQFAQSSTQSCLYWIHHIHFLAFYTFPEGEFPFCLFSTVKRLSSNFIPFLAQKFPKIGKIPKNVAKIKKFPLFKCLHCCSRWHAFRHSKAAESAHGHCQRTVAPVGVAFCAVLFEHGTNSAQQLFVAVHAAGDVQACGIEVKT